MPVVTFSRITAVAVLCLALAGIASAEPPAGIQFETLRPGALHVPNAQFCKVGETRDPNVAVFFQDTNDPKFVFYTLLDPSQCLACSSAVLDLQAAGIAMRFAEHCSILLRVSVVEANGDSICPAPDTTRSIFPYFDTLITDDASDQIKAVEIPFPAGPCLSRRAFLRIEVLHTGCPSNPQRFGVIPYLSQQPCPTCRSYWQYPVSVGGGPVADTCDPDPGIRVVWAQWVTAQCCDLTPTRHQSWGRLKQIYR